MSKKLILFIFFLIPLSAGFLLTRKDEIPLPIQASSYETKEESVGEVTITVTPTRLSYGNQPRFEVKFDTHSVDLDFEVAKIASLTDDKGESFGESIWEGPGPGGHHREGILSFENNIRGRSEINLTFSGILGERKTFSWQVR